MPDMDSIIDGFYRAYNSHDVDQAMLHYADDAFHDEKAFGKRRSGKGPIAEGLAGFFAMLPDVHWQEQQRIVSGTSAVVNYIMTGTMTPRKPDEDGGFRPRPIRLTGLHVFEFSDGQLCGTADYWNLDHFKQQIK